MWEIMAAAILCIFATFGFVAFIKALIFKIYKPESENAIIVLKAENNTEDIEYTLRSLLAKIKWSGKKAFNSIIVVDNELSKEQREICRLLCQESEIFKLYTPIELYKLFKEKDT